MRKQPLWNDFAVNERDGDVTTVIALGGSGMPRTVHTIRTCATPTSRIPDYGG
jgi:hypothetical protein